MDTSTRESLNRILKVMDAIGGLKPNDREKLYQHLKHELHRPLNRR